MKLSTWFAAGLVAAVALTTTAVVAQQDPIAARKDLMKANGRNAGVIVKMVKGEEAYDAAKVKAMLETLELGEDPFRLFGLLAGQAFQLAALAVSEKPDGEVAKDFGAHPFALSKLAPHAKKLGRAGARQVVAAFAEADEAMKTGGEPWLLTERALVKVAQLAK